ncbi:hypothetical protein CS8_071500 [Cupriavidus sp. 8B]
MSQYPFEGEEAPEHRKPDQRKSRTEFEVRWNANPVHDAAAERRTNRDRDLNYADEQSVKKPGTVSAWARTPVAGQSIACTTGIAPN